MIHFIRPEWLLALVPLILLSLLFWRRHQQQSAWKAYIAPHLSRMLINDGSKQSNKPKGLLAFCWIIAVLALAGPAISKQNLPVFATDQGRVLIMDMSYSMYATDLTPNRLSHARFRATDLLSDIKEGETGLIAYAGDAFTISPLTRDNGTLLNLLPTLSPDIMPVRGSNLSSAITLAQQLLAQGGHVTGDIILMTDGVSDQQFNQVYNELKNSRYRLSILAFGSKTGAPIKLSDGQLMRDSSNEVVVAKTDIKLLHKLAKQGSGILIAAKSDGSDIKQLVQWLAEDGQAKATELEGESWQDLGPYLALLLLLPMLLSFKHGVLANLILPTSWLPLAGLIGLFAFSTSYSQPAQANVWDNLWLTADQQAQQAFDKKEYAKAAANFSPPNWQASAHYKAGNYQQALEGFELDNSAEGLYNQANSLMQLGNLPEAIKRYQQALGLRADFIEAEENLALAQQLLEQQSQKDQQDSDNNEQNDSQDKDQQSNDPNNKQDNQQNQQQNQDQKNSNQQNDQQQDAQESSSDSDQSNQDQQGKQSENAEQDKHSKNNEAPDKQQPEDNQDKNQQQSSGSQSNDKPDDQAAQNTDSDQSESGASESSTEADEPAPSNEASMQANTEQSANAESSDAKNVEQSNQQMASGKSLEETLDEDGKPINQAISPTTIGQQPLPEDMERALRAINEDPQVLIRNKMQLEYQKRRQQVKEKEQW
ncbi:VWA domain-containing protein [Shewanella sp. OMA3-2]|uniref:VWA domain-containing protein n=1 Tax=Shewanella sp. OMA3-2 TaxID=2908650 RepID=UPI001F2E1FBE|nr:VWA domain-containing protein [Shewanella sp. OMA3-2]UJF23182.1 VWA domain-containing protein [Shewanella sp. OMA3-2]